MKRASAYAAFVLLLWAPCLGRSQEPPPAPVFPARADLVLLDLVVRDKAGRLVDDLRADEVQVREDGKPCAVRSFRLVQAESGGTAAVPATGPVALPAAKPEAETARPAPTGDGLVSVVALVFDQLGSEAASNARAAALQLPDRSFPKGSVFAVFKVGQGLAVLQSFTEDRALLPAAIEKATTGADQARDPARRAGFDNATEEALSLARQAQAAARNKEPDARLRAMEAQMLLFSDSVTREGQGQASLQPLLAIARALSLVQGRKSLLYFSEGLTVPPSGRGPLPVDGEHCQPVERVGLRVRRAGAACPLAHRKRRSWPSTWPARPPSPIRSAAPCPTRPCPPWGSTPSEMSRDALRLNRQGVLRDLAESTGGFLVAETNDLRPGLERVVADLRAYYEVGYVPPTPKADGRWRAISVKVSRPGVVVRTRRGYYALPPGAPVVLPYELALAEALAASAMPHDVEHRAATLRFAGGEARDRDARVGRGADRRARSHPRRDDVPRSREPARPGQGRNGHARGAAQPRCADRGPARRARESRERRTSVVRRTLRLPAGAIRPRDGGPGPRERSGRRPARRVRDSRARPVAQPGQRRDRARRRGGRGRARVRRSPAGGPAARDPASRPVVSRGNTGRLALLQPPRRLRRSPSGGGARVPAGRAGVRAHEARAARARRRGAHHVRGKLHHRQPRAGPVRGLGAWPAGRRRGHRGHRVHDHSPAAARRRALRARRHRGPGERRDPAHDDPRARLPVRPGVRGDLPRPGGRRVVPTVGARPERRTRTGGAHPPLRPRLHPPAGPAALGHVPRRLRGRRAGGARPGSAAREAALRDGGAGGRAGVGDPGRGRALQPGALPQRERPDPRPPLPPVGEPGPALLQAEGHEDDRRVPRGGGRLRREGEADDHPRPARRRRAGERAVLDRRQPGRGPAHGDRVRPGAGQEHARLQRVESRASSRPSTGAKSPSALSCPTR